MEELLVVVLSLLLLHGFPGPSLGRLDRILGLSGRLPSRTRVAGLLGGPAGVL